MPLRGHIRKTRLHFSLKIKLQLVKLQIEHQERSYRTDIISVTLASLSGKSSPLSVQCEATPQLSTAPKTTQNKTKHPLGGTNKAKKPHNIRSPKTRSKPPVARAFALPSSSCSSQRRPLQTPPRYAAATPGSSRCASSPSPSASPRSP